MLSERNLNPASRVSVLAISPHPEDHRNLSCIFQRSNWDLRIASTCREATEILESEAIAIVICEHTLPDGTWRDVLACLSATGVPYRILVTSRCADERLWCDVLDAGGYDCIVKPFQSDEVFRLVSLAWQSWKHEVERAMHRATGPMRVSAVA